MTSAWDPLTGKSIADDELSDLLAAAGGHCKAPPPDNVEMAAAGANDDDVKNFDAVCIQLQDGTHGSVLHVLSHTMHARFVPTILCASPVLMYGWRCRVLRLRASWAARD